MQASWSRIEGKTDVDKRNPVAVPHGVSHVFVFVFVFVFLLHLYCISNICISLDAGSSKVFDRQKGSSVRCRGGSVVGHFGFVF